MSDDDEVQLPNEDMKNRCDRQPEPKLCPKVEPAAEIRGMTQHNNSRKCPGRDTLFHNMKKKKKKKHNFRNTSCIDPISD